MSKTSSVIVLEVRLVTSAAWLSLTGAAPLVYLIFRCKCQFVKAQNKPGKRSRDYIIANDGQIEFCYIEARDKYGISADRFRRALDELIVKGFIDLRMMGGGTYKAKSLYAISERWKEYGTESFQQAERPASPAKTRGCFPRGNQLGRNAPKESSTRVNPHGSIRVNPHGEPTAIRVNPHGSESENLRNTLRENDLCSEIA